MSSYANNGVPLDWDDEIQYTESSFILLPAGEYPFTVTGFDRQNYDGSEKIPACKMAVLHLAVDGGGQGVANVDERLYLHTSAMWKLSEFFVSIGQLQKDGAVRMNWNAVPGAVCTVKLSVNKYSNKKGEERTNNRVEHFLPPVRQPAPPHPAAPAPQWQQPVQGQQTAMNGFQRQGRVGDYQAEKF